MRRSVTIGVATLLAAASAGALALAGAPRAQARRAAGSPPAASADEAAEVLAGARGYRSWSVFRQYAGGAVLSKAHGGTHVVAWYNEAAARAARGGGPYPDGSVLVKENRPAAGAAPAALTVMAKRGGAWYWLRATPDWQVATKDGVPVAGRDVAACAGCHTNAPTDMVFSR